MKNTNLTFAISFAAVFLIMVCALTFENRSLKSERDALREEVAWLYDAGERVDSLNAELRTTLGDCNELLKVFLPPDTTKKFVRARHIPGLDIMPVIGSCSLYIVTAPRVIIFRNSVQYPRRKPETLIRKGADE